MKILIIGGTGFVGRHITFQLASQGHDVRVFSRGLYEVELPEGVRRINADMDSLAAYAPVLQKLAFDVVIHMIAMTREHAEAAVETFAGYAGRMVLASSQDVYAAFGALLGKEKLEPRSNMPIAEDGPRRSSRYLHGGDYEKLDVEWEFVKSSDVLPVVIMRMPAVYGPHDRQRRFYPHVKRMMDKRPAVLLDPGFGNFRWSHAYCENVAHAFALAATNDAVRNKVYNIAEVRTPTVAERLHALARAANYRGHIVVAPQEKFPKQLLKDVDFSHDLAFDDRAIRRDLGYTEIVPEDEALKRTVAWLRENPPENPDPAEFNYAAEDPILAELGLLRAGSSST